MMFTGIQDFYLIMALIILRKKLLKKDTVLGSQPINYSSQGSLEYGTKEDFVVPYLKSSLPVYNLNFAQK